MNTPLRCLLPASIALLLAINGPLLHAQTPIFQSLIALTGTTNDDRLYLGAATNASLTTSITTNALSVIGTIVTGIDGLDGDDQIIGANFLNAHAETLTDTALKFSANEGEAIAQGISGGNGNDAITNLGAIFATSKANTFAGEFIMQIDIGMTGWPTIAESSAVGLSGDAGVDTLVNEGLLTAAAESYSRVIKGRIGTIEIPANVLGFGDASTTADARAVGLSAGSRGSGSSNALDTMINRGLMTVSACATSTTGQGIIELLGAARVDDRTMATANAFGIEGSGAADAIHNSGGIAVNSAADAALYSGELKMKGLLLMGVFDALGFDVGKVNTIAGAGATGIDAGDGNDFIVNSGTNGLIDASSHAEAYSLHFTVAISPPLGGGASQSAMLDQPVVQMAGSITNSFPTNGAYADADTKAWAEAVGTAGGAGNDTILNAATQRATSQAYAQSLGVNADVSISSSSYFPFPSAGFVNTATFASASAVGLDGGIGNDLIVNSGLLQSQANADSDTLTVGAAISGSTQFFAVGVTVVDASSEANARVAAIVGGTGSDVITNTGVIQASAASRSDSTGITVALTGTEVGLAAGVALGDSSTIARASASGIDAGDTNVLANEYVVNAGSMGVTAAGTNSSLSVGVSFTASVEGIAGGVSAVKADAVGDAAAVGIQTGWGNDTIIGESNGVLNVSAVASSSSQSMSVTVAAAEEGAAISAALGKATTTATANSVAIDSDFGNDQIWNSTAITNSTLAEAYSAATAISANGAWQGASIGASLGITTTISAATNIGIATGAGNDWVLNDGAIWGRAAADAEARSSSVTIAFAIEGVSAGVACAQSGANADAIAEGINGGDGVDTIVQRSFVSAESSAETSVRSVSINFALLGATFADVTSTATAQARGLLGGDGSDWLQNEGVVRASSSSSIHASATGANLTGYASADLAMTNTAIAIGIDGGTGIGATAGDTITNALGARVVVDSFATNNAVNRLIQGGGGAILDIEANAAAVSAGLNGGALADQLINNGSVDVKAISGMNVQNTSFQLFGLQLATAGAHATAFAAGINAGNGSNVVQNGVSGSISNYASVNTEALGIAADIAGVNVLLTGTDAEAVSHGILTGTGADWIQNAGNIDSSAASYAIAGAASMGLFSAQYAGAFSRAHVDGINAGDGQDWIENLGTITVGTVRPGDEAVASGYSVTASADLFSFAMSTLGAHADATGIVAGNGDDAVVNSGTIDVGQADQWLAKASSEGYGGQLAGSANAYAGSSSEALAAGIDAGSGGDVVVNATTGNINVNSRSRTDTRTEAYEFIGLLLPTTAHSSSTATAAATGIQAGADSDGVLNDGTIEAAADALTTASASSTVDIDTSIPVAEAEGSSTATAAGVDLGAGQNWANNGGTIAATAVAQTTSGATTDSTFDAGEAESSGRPIATATGILGGNDGNVVLNRFLVSAHATADTSFSFLGIQLPAINASGSDGQTANADAGWSWAPVLATATGVALGNGGDTVTNQASINSIADCAAFSAASTHVWYRSTTAATDSYGRAIARGIDVGEGQNVVVNNGAIQATATTDARAWANSFSRDYSPTSRATANADALAEGIRAGDTGNYIENNGTINVLASAESGANAYAEEDWSSETESAYATATANAQAFGIRIGNGQDYIMNNGTVIATVHTDASASVDTEDGDVEVPSTTRSGTAIGIQSGGGDDWIVNAGRIVATNFTGAPIAIDAGDGDDTVTLRPGSETWGDIRLGNGNDYVQFTGASLGTGRCDGGSNYDTVVFLGFGATACQFANFESLIKYGAGTFEVDPLPGMERLEVQQGILQINGNYQFASNGTYATSMSRDGVSGCVDVTGTADLSGSLSIQRGRGAYANGTTVTVLEADDLNGQFAQELLPASTPLLSFRVNYLDVPGDAAVQVQAVAKSFTTVAHNRLERAIGNYLDRALPRATGNFSDLLGEFQLLSEAEFRLAFASFSPAVYDAGALGVFREAREYMRALQQHMRVGRTTFAPMPSPNARATAPAGSDRSSNHAFVQSADPAVWLQGFGLWEKQDGADGFPGFDYQAGGTSLGFDYTMGERLLTGVNVGYSSGNVDLPDNQAHSDIDSFYGSMYATRMFEKAYLEGALAYGRHENESRRLIQLGPLQDVAESDHNANTFSALLGAGTTWSAIKWQLQPMAALNYTWLNEEAFAESGAGPLNMQVDSRNTHSLKSELSVRLARPIPAGKSIVIPEISIGWEYDFKVDDRVITGSFAGQPGTGFSVPGQGTEQNSAVEHAAVIWLTRGRFASSINYDARVNNGQTVQGVSGELRFSL